MQLIRCKGFTLIELLVVIAIIAILAAILFPVFASAKEKGKAAMCAGHLGQLGKAVLGYSDDYNGKFPHQQPDPKGRGDAYDQTQPGYVDMWQTTSIPNWAGDIAKYLKNRGAFVCPSTVTGKPNAWEAKQSYCGNGLLFEQSLSQSSVVRPSKTVVLYGGVFFWRGSPCAPNLGYVRAGAPLAWSKGYLYGPPCVNHSGGHNCLFADGHVKWYSYEALKNHSRWWSPDGKPWYSGQILSRD